MQPPPLGASSLPASLHPWPQLLLPPAGFFPCHPYHQPPHALLQVITQYLNQAFLENSSPLAPAIPCCLPGSSAGKKSTCNAGDPGSIPGLGRSAREGIGYPLQHSCASLAQLVKNLPAMQETWVQSLYWEDPLEKGMATHSSILAWRILWTV